ncbi:hypothetical protein ACMTAU_07325, partial [Alcaligenes pakistanensis]
LQSQHVQGVDIEHW